MVNTLINLSTTDHVPGSLLQFNIMPGIFFILALITFTLTTFTSTTFTSVIFSLIIFALITFILISPMLIASGSIIPEVVDSLKTVFFEGVL
jgi:hypothetical protein